MEFLTLLGEVFQVDEKARVLVDKLGSDMEKVASAVADREPVSAIVAFPSMGVKPDVPAVWIGGIYDDVLRRAGAEPAFAGEDSSLTSEMSAEQLATANVELLVLGVTSAEEDGAAEAEKIFAAYPDWQASKDKRYVVVSDGVYFGPLNSLAVDKIARAAHPDAF